MVSKVLYNISKILNNLLPAHSNLLKTYLFILQKHYTEVLTSSFALVLGPKGISRAHSKSERGEVVAFREIINIYSHLDERITYL